MSETEYAVPTDPGGQVQVTEHHLPKDVFYVRIAVALAVITAIEVAVSYIDVPTAVELTALLTLMAIKFVLVASNFMHLKFDDKLLTRVFYAGLLLAVSVYIAVMCSMQLFGS